MLQNLRQFYGKKLGAVDGHIGHVKDFYFDDHTWTIRYLVADTGSWLPGRQVLLPARAFVPGALERAQTADNDLLHVNRTRRQIEESPAIETHRPVSRQYEEAYHRFNDWSPYWPAGSRDDHLDAAPGGLDPAGPPAGDPQLRSTLAVTGYQVKATDGPVGTISGFVIHGTDWTIRELLIQGNHAWDDEEFSVSPADVDRISYPEATVFLTRSKAAMRSAVAPAPV